MGRQQREGRRAEQLEEAGAGHCSHQFCISPDYEKLELPPPSDNSSVVEVVITPHILEIFEVIMCNYLESHVLIFIPS